MPRATKAKDLRKQIRALEIRMKRLKSLQRKALGGGNKEVEFEALCKALRCQADRDCLIAELAVTLIVQ